jgi:hypothetical protein
MLGEAANVYIADPDANENAAVVDSIRVFTSSSSAIDQAGRELSANETGWYGRIQSRFSHSFTNCRWSWGNDYLGKWQRQGRDFVYRQAYAADYSDKISSGENPEKEFFLEISFEEPDRAPQTIFVYLSSF